MSLFHKPAANWAGDVIPLYWQGEYHLFYVAITSITRAYLPVKRS